MCIFLVSAFAPFRRVYFLSGLSPFPRLDSSLKFRAVGRRGDGRGDGRGDALICLYFLLDFCPPDLTCIFREIVN